MKINMTFDFDRSEYLELKNLIKSDKKEDTPIQHNDYRVAIRKLLKDLLLKNTESITHPFAEN